MWKYTHTPRFPVEYVEQIERDPSCLEGTTWVRRDPYGKDPDTTLLVRKVQLDPTFETTHVAYVFPLPALPESIACIYLSYFIEYCVPWTPPTGPTSWERLLVDDGL